MKCVCITSNNIITSASVKDWRMSPHGNAGPPDQSSPNLGNKCELGRHQCCQISLHCDKKCARYLPSKLFDPIQGKSEPKFTKTVQDLLQTNVHHHAKFHCSPSDDVRKKCYNFFTHLLILAPQRTPWATVHQSWNWCIARPDLSMCKISSCSVTAWQQVSPYHATTKIQLVHAAKLQQNLLCNIF